MDINENNQRYKVFSTLLKHGGNIDQEATDLGVNADQLLDASASIVPFSPPYQLLKCLSKALHSPNLRSYPDRNHCLLRESIANWHNIDPDMVLPGNGASELITWSAKDASMLGSNGLLAPCFSDYERALRCWGGDFSYIPMDLFWGPEIPQPFTITSDAQVLWITNPHNPTGQLWDRNSLLPLLHKHRLIICDEAFLPLVPNGEKQSLIPFVSEYKNLIVIRSLTKLFAVAGLRIGYAISSSLRLKQWKDWRDPWPMNNLAITTGIMMMTNKELTNKWITKIQHWISNEGPWLHFQLQKLPGIKAHPSSANFQLIESHHSLTNLRKKLAQNKILLRDCRSFENLNSHWLRISLQNRYNNKKIINSMQKIIKESL